MSSCVEAQFNDLSFDTVGARRKELCTDLCFLLTEAVIVRTLSSSDTPKRNLVLVLYFSCRTLSES